MKKDNRGFTLIELLLTIALLAVISIISFVSINAIINKNKDNDCVSVVNNIIMAAKEYYSDKRYNETYTTSSITITAASLLAGNYLNGEITDPYTKEQIAGSEIKVIIQLNDDKTIKDVIVTESDGATPIFRSCKNGSGNVMSGIRITKKPTQSYQINYLLHGGKLTNTPPNTVAYEENVVLTNPTKTITVLTNANSNPSAHAEGATISASSVVATQEFLGWSSNTSYGLGSNATRGTTNNPTTSWNGNKTKDDHFFHLRNEVGTVTMVANWQETNITLPEITKEGHTCGWMTKEDGTAIEYASQGWFTPSASTTKLNVNLYAVCNVTTYTITYTLNGGKNNTNNPSSYTIESDDITLANATKTVKVTGNANNTGASVGAATSKAQTFAGWTGSNGTTAQTGVIIPKGSTGDKSYNAKWTPVAMTLPTVVKDYYTCEWWSASTGGSKVGDSGGAYTPTANSKANITVYARCNPVNYTISYTLNGGKNNTNNPSNYTIESSNITIGAATKTVKVTGNANNTGASVGAATSKVQTFKGWTGDNGTTAQTSFTIPTGSTGNKSYTANWTPVAMTLPTISNDGYTCEWWSASSGGSKVGDSGGAYTPTANSKANITVYARCNPVTYTISYTLNNGTNNANNPTSYTIESSNITIAAATKTVKVTGNVNNTGASVGAATSKAQTFKGWTGANGSTAQTGVTIPKGSFGNKSYTANWTPVAMTLPTITKAGYTCEWWSAASSGSKVGDSGGAYTPTANSKASITVYARCNANELAFNNQTLSSGTYGTAYTSNAFTGASNGTGDYTYTIKSGAPDGATIDSAARKISFTNTTTAGTYSVVVHVKDNTSGKEIDATKTIVIKQKSLTPSISSCNNKAYNGNNKAACTIGLATIVSGDAVTGSGTCTFADKNAGNAKTVTCTNVTLSGSQAGNYSLSTANVSKDSVASITPRNINLGTYSDTYNGTTTFTRTFSTGISSENLIVTYASYVKNAGNYSYATTSASEKYTVALADGTGVVSNYNLAGGGVFTINKKALDITAYTINWANGTTYTRNNYSTGIGSEKVNLTYTPYANNAGTYAYTTSNASGKYIITLSNSTNYSIASAGNLTINKIDCPAPTGVTISATGIVTWTNVSVAQSYQISINNSTFTAASNGVDYKSTITAAAGNRTVYVRSVCNSTNYNTPSTAASSSVSVYTVTLTSGTGISSVTGAGNYISGATVQLNATAASNYIFKKWTQTSGGATVSTVKQYSATITSDWNYTAIGVEVCTIQFDISAQSSNYIYTACPANQLVEVGSVFGNLPHQGESEYFYHGSAPTSYICYGDNYGECPGLSFYHYSWSNYRGTYKYATAEYGESTMYSDDVCQSPETITMYATYNCCVHNIGRNICDKNYC